MIRWSAVLIIFFLSGISSACRSVNVTQSLPQSVVQEPSDPSLFIWRRTSDSEYFDKLFKGTPLAAEITRANTLGPEHELQRRLDFWVDAFHNYLSREQGLGRVPRPRVKLIRSMQVNAMVARGLVCLELPAVFMGDAKQGSENEILAFARRDQEFSLGESTQRCLPSRLSPEQERELISWQFSPYPECKPQFEAGRVVFPASCGGPKSRKLRLSGKRLAFTVVPDQITVYTGLVRSMSEEQTVAILAHELVHYYRAHALTPEKYHQIFYRLGSTKIGSRPLDLPAARAIGEPILKQLDYGFDQYHSFRKQKYHSVFADVFLFKMADAYPKMLCSGQGPTMGCAACLNYRAAAKDAAARKLFESFPRSPLPEARIADYMRLENAAQACFRQVPMSDKEDASLEISRPGLKKLIAAFSESLAADVPEVPKHMNLDATLLELTLRFWQRELSVIQKLRTLTEEANSFGLGYYTTEQEADELSLVWTHALGIEPKAAVEAVLTLSRASGKLNETRRFESCEELYQRQWRDREGRLVMIPIGTLRSAHHDNCFRAYNMDREIKAYGLQLGQRKTAQLPPGRSWIELQKSPDLRPGTPALIGSRR